MRKLISLYFLILAAMLMASCDQKQSVEYKPKYARVPLIETKNNEFVIGVHPMHNPKMIHRAFDPIADYLSKNIEGASFKIESSLNFEVYNQNIKNRKFHFILPNPFQTVNSFRYGYNVIVKMSNDDNFRGVILVRKDSHIKKLIELKGASISFPAPSALAASMLTQYDLKQQGVDIVKDVNAKYVGSKESSIMNVMLGNTNAAGTCLASWRALSKKRPKLAKELTVVWQTASLPHNSFMARDDINESDVNSAQATRNKKEV